MVARTLRSVVTLVFVLAPLVVAQAQPVTQPFTFSIVPQTLPQIRHGDVVWGDYDNDGDLDVLVSGQQQNGQLTTRVYRNDGKTLDAAFADSMVAFTSNAAAMQALAYSRGAWGDYDGDGDLDLVVQGSRSFDFPYEPVTTLYRNDGGSFVADGEVELVSLHSGSADWGDYDNDGDVDLLLTGEGENDERITQLYRNDGGSFEAVATDLAGIAFGQAVWGDYDRDQDMDVLLVGASAEGFVANVYRNDGNAQFVSIGAPLEPVAFSSVDWGDYDSDGDLDILLSGGQLSSLIFDGVTRVYRNTNGAFADAGVDMAGTLAGASTWGDYDSDGDLDILVLGAEEALGRRTARIYRNDDNTFVNTNFLVGAIFASADWGDLEGDGDLDLLSSGFLSAGPYVTNLYENRRQVIPPVPGTPQQLRVDVVDEETVTLHWETPVEAEMPLTGWTYNLRVGTSPDGTDIVAPLADPATGQRLLASLGNVNQNTSWTLSDLPGGTYYWSVQAIDHAYQGSAFAAEGSFTVAGVAVSNEADATLPTAFAVHPNYPNPFTTVTTIRYDVPTASHVLLKVYDVLGKEVATLVNRTHEAGHHQVEWHARASAGAAIGAGIYFYELRAGSTRHTGTMTFVK